MALLEFTESGIYCKVGDFYIDPWRTVARAVITHAHSDHSRPGMGKYLAHVHSVPVMKLRLGANIQVNGVPYGKKVYINGVQVSFHPAGHIIGSAQVRVEYKGEVWVASGDYKLGNDGVSIPFEPVKCHAFISESTFGLPVFKWRPDAEIYAEMNTWWQENQKAGRTSVITAYSLGKAQRVLQNIDAAIGPIYTHGSVELINGVLRADHNLPETQIASAVKDKKELASGLVICPPSAVDGPWMKRFVNPNVAFASGWMALRGARRRGGNERGFVLSDHADWEGLIEAVKATECEKLIVTHGYQAAFARYCQENLGIDARDAKTEFTGESLDIESVATGDEEAI
jgi:putative mRNA 3-end processing factor